MASTSQIRAQGGEKLISEYPFREGLNLYLEAWKELIWTSVKTIIVVACCLVAVQLASTFLTVATVLGAASSALMFLANLIIAHPFLTGALFVALFVAVLALRSAHSKAVSG